MPLQCDQADTPANVIVSREDHSSFETPKPATRSHRPNTDFDHHTVHSGALGKSWHPTHGLWFFVRIQKDSKLGQAITALPEIQRMSIL